MFDHSRIARSQSCFIHLWEFIHLRVQQHLFCALSSWLVFVKNCVVRPQVLSKIHYCIGKNDTDLIELTNNHDLMLFLSNGPKTPS